MDIRSQIAREWIQELQLVDEENALLMRETVLSSFSLDSIPVVDPAQVRCEQGGGGGSVLPL